MKDAIRMCDICLKNFSRDEFMTYITGEFRAGLCCSKCTKKIINGDK